LDNIILSTALHAERDHADFATSQDVWAYDFMHEIIVTKLTNHSAML